MQNNDRPKLHFSPRRGWINDPNGLVYDGKQYHLFAQHNPDDIVWGPMHWLHAVSDDLIHWRELGIALWPDSLGTIFSGSIVIDQKNTAGFGPGAMVAMYTQHGEREVQSIAYSTDGVHFTPYAGNPVIENPGFRDFRDPKVFWDEKRGRWAMALAASDRIQFFTSSNLRHWNKTGEFGRGESKYGDIFECPDLFPLKAPDGREVWALLVSMAAPAETGGGRMQYYLGEYDGETFVKLPSHPQPLMVDAGFDDYAGVTYHNTAERTYIGWAASPAYAGKVPATDYRGMMTLPRRLTLANTDAGLRLAAEPLHTVSGFAPAADGGALPDGAFELDIRAEGAFEVSIENRLGEVLRFGVDESNAIYTDRSRSSGAPGQKRPTEIREPIRPTDSPPVEGFRSPAPPAAEMGRAEETCETSDASDSAAARRLSKRRTAEPDGVVIGAPRPMDIPWAGNDLYSITRTPCVFSEICDMRLVMDGPIAELYADGGVYVNTMLVYPTEGYATVWCTGKVQMRVAKI